MIECPNCHGDNAVTSPAMPSCTACSNTGLVSGRIVCGHIFDDPDAPLIAEDSMDWDCGPFCPPHY
jgi:hypothetical protein